MSKNSCVWGTGKADQLFEPRDRLVEVLGDKHPAVLALSRTIIALLRSEWLPPAKPRSLPKPASPHILLTQDYQNKVRGWAGDRQDDGYFTNKIQAIKYVRTDTGYGLKDAKDYVEFVLGQVKEPAFLQTLPGYCPF